MSLYRGAIVTKGEKRTFSHQNDTKRDISSSFTHSTDKDRCKRWNNGKRQKQTSVKTFFTELKNEYCLSPGKCPCNRIGGDSACKRVAFMEKVKPTNREKVFVPFCERSGPKKKDHSVSENPVPNNKVELKELSICISNCKAGHLLNKEVSSKSTCENELKAISSLTEKSIPCKVTHYNVSGDSPVKKTSYDMDSASAKQMTRPGVLNQSPSIHMHRTSPHHTIKHTPLLGPEPVSSSPVEVTSSVPSMENITVKVGAIDDVKSALDNKTMSMQNVSRKRLFDEGDINTGCENDTSLPRILRPKVKQNTTESHSKKRKVVCALGMFYGA